LSEGRNRRGRPKMKWDMEVNRVKKQKTVTPEDEVNLQI
jgi:hypothetical protein